MSEPRGVSAKAEELRAKRGTGRASPETEDARRARWRADKQAQRSRAKGSEVEKPREPYVPDPTSIMLSGMLGATIFNLAARIGHHRALTDEETQQLGEAIDPVLWKWLPVLGDWKAEAGLAMVLLMLWQQTTPPKEDEGNAGTGDGSSEAAATDRRGGELRVQGG
jgi:hypothetical protein